MGDRRPPIAWEKEARLHGGEIHHYDALDGLCNREAYNPDEYEYIGDGFIHAVDGVEQTDNKQYSFFVKRLSAMEDANEID